MRRTVHGVEVRGAGLDEATRCAHWHGLLDIIAIRMRCCGEWWACIDCHRELAGHPAAAWPADRFDERAVLCGACGARLTIAEYLGSGARCPSCGAGFNPGCARHYHLYFEMESSGPDGARCPSTDEAGGANDATERDDGDAGAGADADRGDESEGG